MGRGTLFIVGAGSGRPEHLTGEALGIIAGCRFLTAGTRLLGLARKYAPADAETHAIGADLEAVHAFIASGLKEGNVCVLASGDPGCFSILPFLKAHFHDDIQVAPGISSVQLLAARLCLPWQEWDLISLHGRGAVLSGDPPAGATIYFCDASSAPQTVARRLLESMPDCPAAVGANLGGEDEIVHQAGLAEIAGSEFPGNSLLLVMPGQADTNHSDNATAPGIPDHLWLRKEGVPLSKSEVRAVVISKAQPAARRVIWDVGAGTGSYAIECSLLEPRAQVIAVDKKPAACHLVAANAERFGARVEVVCAEAPDGFETLAGPDLVIIGGSEGRLEPIFKAAARALSPGGRLLVTALLEKTKQTAHKLFAESGLVNRSATRVAISRGEEHKWVEQNPVIIFTGDKPEGPQ